MTEGPLTGITVLDLSTVGPATRCSRLLADYGAQVVKVGAPPRAEASEYKLFSTELSKRLADASMDIGGPGTQLRVGTEEAPMVGRAESTYRYTVIDTIGGGTSEVQKNIIATRKLGLPKNF